MSLLTLMVPNKGLVADVWSLLIGGHIHVYRLFQLVKNSMCALHEEVGKWACRLTSRLGLIGNDKLA